MVLFLKPIGQDSPEASFAGLQDSYLAIRGVDSVLDRVRSCWASLDGPVMDGPVMEAL